MKPYKFWTITITLFSLTEIWCVLAGLGLLGIPYRHIYSPLLLLTVLAGMFIEQWRTGKPDPTELHWHRGMDMIGLMYIIPPFLASMGLVSHIFIIMSLITFALLLYRLIALKPVK